MDKPTVEDVVNATKQTKELWDEFLPEDALSAIGPALVNGVIATLRQNKVTVVDDSGAPADLNALANQMSAQFKTEEKKEDKDKDDGEDTPRRERGRSR